MKKILLLTVLLFTLTLITSSASVLPDSIGVKKVGGKNFLIHLIDSSEGWYSIARLYRISYAELRLANKDSADKLIPGRTLLIPADKLKADDPYFDKNYIQTSEELFYTVKAGETLFSIAKQFNTNVDSLKKWNNLQKGGLKYGRKLKVGYDNKVVHHGAKTSEILNGKATIETKDTSASKQKTSSGLVEIKNTMKPKENKPDTASVQKKKLVSDEFKTMKAPTGSIHDTTTGSKKDHDSLVVKKVKENSVTRPDTIKQEKKATTTQTKIIKTATVSSVDTSKIIKTASSAKTNSKKGTSLPPSKARKEISETGVASWIQDDDINPNKYYALHRTATIGTIIKVINKMNKKYVFVKVVGTLPDTGDNTDLVIKISKASAEKLGVRDSRFQSELNYGVNEKP